MSNPEQVLNLRLQAIADPTRRKILRALKEKKAASTGKDGLCGADIEERMRLSQPTISHHMSVLTKAGLIKIKKDGHWRWYQRDEAALREFARGLKANL